MSRKRKNMLIGALLLLWGLYYFGRPWGFFREISQPEAQKRMDYVLSAEKYTGRKEADGSHKEIIDRYNAHEPLAQDYQVTYTDSWCAAFVSAAAIDCGITDIVPAECSCERQIGLWQALGCWEEKDTYIPEPGDLIYYDWDERRLGDSRGWADHVGIVAGVRWPFLKVIEGNRKDSVSYHYVIMGHPQIRGFGLPDFKGHP